VATIGWLVLSLVVGLVGAAIGIVLGHRRRRAVDRDR
jgi:hypothetical protein